MDVPDRTWNDYRPEIEGLRAIAVVAVLLYHARLGPFKGGYIGVDVFFVLSGYLITRLMVAEVGRTATLSLPRFWARRARRLLPASTLVVVATVLLARSSVDPITQGFVDRSALAAAGFFANLLFWTRGGYSQLTLPEPLLHFWSLAVEEQFYVFWPLIIWMIARSRFHFRRLTIAVTAVIGGVSLLLCVTLTSSKQPFAFFWLPTRAWELMVGGGLALVGSGHLHVPTRVRAGAGWLGLLAIVAASVTFLDPQFGFPGVRAMVPVAATALVIIGAGAETPHGPGTLLALPLAGWIGKRSYALYLWHYPLLVLAAARWGPLSVVQRLAVLGMSVAAASVSFALVEDPLRRNKWLAWRPKRSLLMGAALAGTTVVVAMTAMILAPSLDTGIVAAAPVVVTVPDPTSTIGSAPTGRAAPQVPVTLPAMHTNGPVTVPHAAPAGSDLGAVAPSPVGNSSAVTPTASWPASSPTASPSLPFESPIAGVTSPSASSPAAVSPPASVLPDPPPAMSADGPFPPNNDALVALASANRPMLDAAAQNNLVPSNLRPSLSQAYQDRPPIYDNGCILGDNTSTPKDCVYGDPTSAVTVVLFGDSHAAQWFSAMNAAAIDKGWRLLVFTKMGCPTAAVPLTNSVRNQQCGPWRDQVIARLGQLRPQLVVMSSYRYVGSNDTSWKTGLDATLAKLRPQADRVLVLGDTPTPNVDVPSCVSGHLRSLAQCVNTRKGSIRPGRLAVEYQVAQSHNADFVTTADWLCGQQSCPVVIGDVLVYRDNSHLTTTGAALLTPYLEATITPLLPS